MSCTFIISCWILLRMRNVSDKSCRENQNTLSVCSYFFRKSCHLWDNGEKYCRPRQVTDDNIIRCIHIACWITKATYTLRIWNTDCISMTKMVMWTCLNVTFICPLPNLLLTYNNVLFRIFLVPNPLYLIWAEVKSS
jgi:hypothetical protein